MAVFSVEGPDLLLRLTWREAVAGFHVSLRLPLTAVRSVSLPTDAWSSLRGWRMAGTAIRGVIAAGTRRHGEGYDFTMIHRNGIPVQVDLASGRFSRLVVSVPGDPECAREVASLIADSAGIARP